MTRENDPKERCSCNPWTLCLWHYAERRDHEPPARDNQQQHVHGARGTKRAGEHVRRRPGR
jgi:hypothetical protein